jgi:hypothetical protein
VDTFRRVRHAQSTAAVVGSSVSAREAELQEQLAKTQAMLQATVAEVEQATAAVGSIAMRNHRLVLEHARG